MGCRMLATAIGAVEVDRRRRRGTAERAVVADIDPQSSGPGAAKARLQHRDRRVVGVDLLGGEDVIADAVDDRLQQPDRLADPIAQGRAVEVEAVAGTDLALPVQRQMIAIFRDQQMRQHAGGGATGVFRPYIPDHSEPARDIVEDLGDVFTKPSHVAAAGRTGAGAVVLWLVHALLTRQMVWQRLTLWPVPLTDRQRPVFGGSLGD